MKTSRKLKQAKTRSTNLRLPAYTVIFLIINAQLQLYQLEQKRLERVTTVLPIFSDALTILKFGLQLPIQL